MGIDISKIKGSTVAKLTAGGAGGNTTSAPAAPAAPAPKPPPKGGGPKSGPEHDEWERKKSESVGGPALVTPRDRGGGVTRIDTGGKTYYVYLASDGQYYPTGTKDGLRYRPSGVGIPYSPDPSKNPPEGTPVDMSQYLNPGATSGSSSHETEGVSQTYSDYIAWQREQAESTIAAYRAALKSQANAYETRSLAALPKMRKNMWEQMYKNLDQRGLRDSTSFMGGAKTDLEDWNTQQKSDIYETKQSIEATGQQAILAGLGKPDYASLYQNWQNTDQQGADYNEREYQKKYDAWVASGEHGPPPVRGY